MNKTFHFDEKRWVLRKVNFIVPEKKIEIVDDGKPKLSDYVFDIDKFKISNYGFGLLRTYELLYQVENERVMKDRNFIEVLNKTQAYGEWELRMDLLEFVWREAQHMWEYNNLRWRGIDEALNTKNW